jgi:anti-sigma factor RsiW
MNDCRDAIPLLGPALDGELPRADRAWVDEHLAGCSACRDRQALLSAQAGALRQALEARAGAVDFSAFSQRVMARIALDAEQRSASPLERLSVWLREVFAANRFALGAGAGLTAAAALALVVILRPPGPAAKPASDQALALASADQGAHAQADIDELEVYGEEGSVLQLPGQSTVIWVSDVGAVPPRSAQ